MPRKKDLPYNTENDIFATRLREIMQIRGENQTTLSAKTNMQRQTISLYMNGQSKPDTERLTSIAQALNVSSDYLLGLSNVKSLDVNLQAICEYTDLSESTLNNLSDLSKFLFAPLNDLLSSEKLRALLFCLSNLDCSSCLLDDALSGKGYFYQIADGKKIAPYERSFNSDESGKYSYFRLARFEAIEAFTQVIDSIYKTIDFEKRYKDFREKELEEWENTKKNWNNLRTELDDTKSD